MTDPSASTPSSPPRSAFVTTVAWIFIVLSSFATLISLLQNVMVQLMPHDLLATATQDPNFKATAPAGVRFIFAHLQLLLLLFFGVCLITLLSSVGLLRRRNWARQVFIAILGLGIVYNLGAPFLQQSMMPPSPTRSPRTLRPRRTPPSDG